MTQQTEAKLLEALDDMLFIAEGLNQGNGSDEMFDKWDQAKAVAADNRAQNAAGYFVTVTCKGVVPWADRHALDQEPGPDGEQVYCIKADNEEEAAERALDQFHSTIPIKVLDDFEITTEVHHSTDAAREDHDEGCHGTPRTPTNHLWDRNDIQFPRLLCEIVATCDSTDLAAVAESMDLEIGDLNVLFDRAHVEWERIKGEHCP